MSGSCQRYTGTVCSQYIGTNSFIFVSQGLTQTYIEAKLKAAFKVITNSPQVWPFFFKPRLLLS